MEWSIAQPLHNTVTKLTVRILYLSTAEAFILFYDRKAPVWTVLSSVPMPKHHFIKAYIYCNIPHCMMAVVIFMLCLL